MLKRLASIALMLLMGLDQMAQVLVRALPYVLLGRWKPSPNWSVSGYAGGLAYHGYTLGLYCAPLIDDLMGAGHCARAYLHDKTIAPGADPV